MGRRVGEVGTIVVVGILCTAAFAVVSGVCRQHLHARWRGQNGLGPPVALSPWCAPSHAAHEYVLEVAWGAGGIALTAAGVALLALLARMALGRERTQRARAVIGWINLCALALMMFALAVVAGCGEGEWQFFSLPPLAAGSIASAIGAFVGVPTRHPQTAG